MIDDDWLMIIEGCRILLESIFTPSIIINQPSVLLYNINLLEMITHLESSWPTFFQTDKR